MNNWKNRFLKILSTMRGTALPTSYDLEIDGTQYCEQSNVEVDGQRYVLLCDSHDSSNFMIRRLCEYYDPLESEEEFKTILNIFRTQQATKQKNLRRRRIIFYIVSFTITVLTLGAYTLFVYNYDHQVFKNELLCYCLLAGCFCIVNHNIRHKSTSMAIISSILFAVAFTVSVFLLNNLWRYIYENVRFCWGRPNGNAFYWPYLSVLKSDFLYTVGIGRFRYWIVFLVSSAGILTDTFILNKHYRNILFKSHNK